VQGDWGSNNTQFGAHILMHSPKHLQRARLLLSHVEIRRAGQTGGLGRYPVHMHLHGDGSDSFLQVRRMSSGSKLMLRWNCHLPLPAPAAA
jgi:hypothetical protein